ncbi:MAG TPA: GNAT family N-acetyltransferase [Candidatus Kapabacteria bacterium]|nr:GNAT family N-acetyltransferase [Candidatus Kapabacteria bacterium]
MQTTILPQTDVHIGIRVEEYNHALHRDLWDAFVLRSMNGTVFHTQQFLEYHPAGRFEFHHLLFFKDERIVAVLAGGFRNNGKIYESPLGASYGSFVVEDISADTALAIVTAFEEYVRSKKIEEVYLTSAPVIYSPVITQNLDFALLYKGYSYQRHYISHAIDLRSGGAPFERFQSTARKHIRRITREHPEVTIEEVPQTEMIRGLREFYPILLENKAKFGAKPTHTLDELLQLNALLPDLMKLFLVRSGGEAVAGSLLFLANRRVALIFYHMLRYAYDNIKPIYLLMNAVTFWSQQNGYAFVDIGVSQDTSDENPMTPALSLIRFKEKFDSRGLLRSTMWKHYPS